MKNTPAGLPFIPDHPYGRVTPEILAQLGTLLGEQNVIHGDPERLHDYGHDETIAATGVYLPDVVVKPDSATQVSGIMRLADRELIPVTPRGAGSGLSGGAVPLYGGILLSLERMNRILEIDRENMVVVVEPGVITNDISEAVKKQGFFYSAYPMSVETCFIGGNVAENAGGGKAIKYGVTSRYVLGLQVVLPTGEILELGGKRVKDVTGYDLVHLMVGSEGTLGIFTRITLRLMPMPAARAVLLVPYADVSTAIAAVPKIITEGHTIPASIEFMDRFAVRSAYEYVGERPPRPDIGAMLLIEVDGSSREQVKAEYNVIVDLCLEGGALDVYVGDTPATEKKMWKVRQNMAEALTTLYPVQVSEDLVVPPAQIRDLVPLLADLAQQYGLLIPCFGHAGDGNLHVRVIKREEMSLEPWRALLPTIRKDLYRAVAGLGGTISGEHGIGAKHKNYLPLVMDPALIALQRRVKQAFDPRNILNPGKIFPDA